MDCQINLTNHDITNVIAVLYLQTHLDDNIALSLIDKLNNELERCIIEQNNNQTESSPKHLQTRQQLTRQLYFQHRPAN